MNVKGAVAALACLLVLANYQGRVSPAQAANSSAEQTLAPERMLLVNLRLGAMTLAEALPAYRNGSSIMLPLGAVTDALRFPITVTPDRGVARGWFLSEDRTFHLTIPTGVVRITGDAGAYDPGLVEANDADIFVDIRLLSRWFPVDFRFDMGNLLVHLDSREPLPVEKDLARERRRQRQMAGEAPEMPPRRDIPYSALSLPFAHLDTVSRARRDIDGITHLSSEYSLEAHGDLAWMSGNLYAAGESSETLDDLRLSLERRNPAGEVFGERLSGLGVTHFALGDIFGPATPLVADSRLGRGVMISTMPLGTAEQFDQATIEGNLSRGWEVELYRNGVLLDFQDRPEDGRYRFQEVPLLYGLNVFRLVFYGPQGQERVEFRRFRVGQDLRRAGEVDVRFLAARHRRPLLLRDDRADPKLEGRRRLQVEAITGVTRNLSLGTTFAELPVVDAGLQRYATGSLRLMAGDMLLRTDHTDQIEGGTATQLSVTARPFGLSTFAEHTLFDDFFSEDVRRSDDLLESRTSLRFEGGVPETVLPPIPFTLRLAQETRQSGDTETSVRQRMSTWVSGLSVTHDLTWRRLTSDGDMDADLNGSLLLGGRIGPWRLRGQGGYELRPERRLTLLSGRVDYTVNDVWSLRGGIENSRAGVDETSLSAGVGAQMDRMALGLELSASDTGEQEALLTVAFSLGRNPRTGDLHMSGRDISADGAAAVRTFLDRDGNRTFDADTDQPLQGVGFQAGRYRLPQKTGAEGHALLPGLDPHETVPLTLDEGSLPDPYMRADPRGHTIVPRPGVAAELDFPVVTTGGVDGIVYRRGADGTQRAVSGARVQLVEADTGEVVAVDSSAYDGFYLFDYVPPGRYRLRVAPAQLTELGLTSSGPLDITIGPRGSIASGQDLLLHPVKPSSGE